MTESKDKHVFVLTGPHASGKSTHATYLQETTRGQKIEGGNVLPESSRSLADSRGLIPDAQFVPALSHILDQVQNRRVIIENIPRTKTQAEILLNWSRRRNYNLHLITLSLSEEEVIERLRTRLVCLVCQESYHALLKPPVVEGFCDKDGHGSLVPKRGDNDVVARRDFRLYQQETTELMEVLSRESSVHEINALGTVEEVARKVFLELSPYICQEAGMARGYYLLRSLCHPSYGEHIFIAGMSTYIHNPDLDEFKDFDILVPDSKIEEIAARIGEEVQEKRSAHADTRSVYPGDSVEAISDLIVHVGDQDIPFPFEFLWEEVKFIRFMGMKCPFMGIEDLMLLYAALARQGKDYYGKEKRDLTNLAYLAGRSSVDWLRLRERTQRLGMMDRLTDKLQEVGISQW